MVPPMWIDEFKLPDDCCSVSDIEDYYNISVSCHENIWNVKRYPLILILIFTSKRMNNRLVFKIKDGYKLELKTPETIKLFCSTKKFNRQSKGWSKCTKSWSGWSSFNTM